MTTTQEVAWEQFLRELNTGIASVEYLEYYARVEDRVSGCHPTQEKLDAILKEELEALAVSFEMVTTPDHNGGRHSSKANNLRISQQPLMHAVHEKLIKDGHIVLREA